MNAHKDASRSKTLARGLWLLERLSERDAPAGVREFARELELNPALVQRLINTLADAGFVEQEPVTRRYRVGPKALRVGRAYIAGHGLVESAGPILRDLSDDMDLNVYLGVQSGDRCTYLLVLKSPGKLSVNVAPGDQMPLHSTAMGRALLAGLADDMLQTLVEKSRNDPGATSVDLDVKRMAHEISAVRAGRVAVSNEENIPGVFAVGAPVRDHESRIVAAISGACAAHEIDDERQELMSEVVLAAARGISQRMGA